MVLFQPPEMNSVLSLPRVPNNSRASSNEESAVKSSVSRLSNSNSQMRYAVVTPFENLDSRIFTEAAFVTREQRENGAVHAALVFVTSTSRCL